jgi:hypothetical protein
VKISAGITENVLAGDTDLQRERQDILGWDFGDLLQRLRKDSPVSFAQWSAGGDTRSR